MATGMVFILTVSLGVGIGLLSLGIILLVTGLRMKAGSNNKQD